MRLRNWRRTLVSFYISLPYGDVMCLLFKVHSLVRFSIGGKCK